MPRTSLTLPVTALMAVTAGVLTVVDRRAEWGVMWLDPSVVNNPSSQGIIWEQVHTCLSSSEAVWEDLMCSFLLSRRCCTQAVSSVGKWMSKCVWVVSPVIQSHCGNPNHGAQGCDFRAGGGYFFSNYLSQKPTVQVLHCAFRWEYKPSNCPGVTHSQSAIRSNAKSHSHSVSPPLSRVTQLVDLCYSLLKKNSNFAHFLVLPRHLTQVLSTRTLNTVHI